MPIYLTKEEMEFIHANKGAMKQVDIARTLNRSHRTIWFHIHGKVDLRFVRVNKPKVIKEEIVKPVRDPQNIDEFLKDLSREYSY